MRPTTLALSLLLLSGCKNALVLVNDCPVTMKRASAETLYFGAARPDGTAVSEAEWGAFLATNVTPRFPNGFTWWKASGQWRSQSGELVEEGSFVVRIVHGSTRAELDRVKELVTAYRAEHAQESVLREWSATCVSF